ncbi:acetyl-CoA acetyltransferase [Gemella morbillorum M424]|uniref:acetyl-CoA C-acetyltransferase n=1 Tax=Gemella morbillorum TaxID=29391 RepID=A0AAP9HCZ8_9BACL|nr:acetyl-CoA C-acetyltransferase [Gemella morbillorum]EFV35008.1 acetyl-CoA acetyltransferase [Gemella morbillorum M424]QGS09047.1 acetyl-CoA C-acyltransferase [Gemella morbillorum]
MSRVAIVSAKRTAIGSFGGSLKDIPAATLGAEVVKKSLEEINLSPTLVDEVIFGNVLGAGLGQNIARQIAIFAGIPQEKSAFVVNKVCGSGLKSVVLGAQSILLGDNDIVVCGGVENMSTAPYYTKDARFGAKLGNFELEDSIIHDGLTDAFENYHMGITAENIAEQFAISREQQDEFAVLSQQKASAAIEKGKFSNEIVPITIKTRKEEKVFDTDEFVRSSTNLESLAKLRPAFKKDGTVTAGNASGINDGAACVILMSEKRANELGINILGFIDGYATAGLDNKVMGLGPIPATRKVLDKLNLTTDDIDLFELNEAFAAQSIAVLNELNLDTSKVNINGGAIALGHPIGASGCRILVSLVHELINENKNRGLCSLCIGGGQGISVVISRN